MQNNTDLDTLRHSAAHLMARAVMRLYPNVQLAFGPTVENGFYYDFAMVHRLAEDDFPKIERLLCQNAVRRQVSVFCLKVGSRPPGDCVRYSAQEAVHVCFSVSRLRSAIADPPPGGRRLPLMRQ